MSENKAASEQQNSRRDTLKLLVRGLMIFGVEKDAIVGISAALQTEEQQYKLMDWMAENRGATVSDILEKTVEILDEYITEESDDMGLSKTDFMRGMQCPKMLWLDAHKPDQKVIPPTTQQRLDRGNEFGDKAMAMFGPFVEVTEYIPNTKYLNKVKMVRNTKNAMAQGADNICEASFEYEGFFCAVDILHRLEGDVWEMYEVKDSPEIKPQFIKDAAYQAWVLDKCGIALDGVYVVYHYDDEADPFEPVDVTDEAIEYAKVIEQNVYRLAEVKEAKEEIMVPCGEQCEAPYECWYRDYCRGLEDNHERGKTD